MTFAEVYIPLLQENGFFYLRIVKEGKGKTMEEIREITEYREYLLQKELSENTIHVYVRQAKLFLEYLGGVTATKKLLLEYKKHLLGQNRKISSTNLYIVAVNSYLKYVGLSKCIIKTERIQKHRSLENVISLEEYRRILAYAKESGREKYYHIIRVLAFTGIRVSEFAFLTVDALPTGKFAVGNKGKTREVYLPEKLVSELTAYCETEMITAGVIFTGYQGRAIHRASIYKMLIHLADMTGVDKKKAHPHSFRHLFALTYMRQYADLTELADLLGHSSLETTRIYTTTTAEEKRSRLNNLVF